MRAWLGLAACTLLLAGWADGRIKLFLTQRVLQFRRDHPDLFERGSYLPAETLGASTFKLLVCLDPNIPLP